MNSTFRFFLSTTLAGVFLLIPLVALGFLLYIIYEVMVGLARASSLNLPYNDFVNGLVIGACALASVLLVCFLVGLVLRTSLGSTLGNRYDELLDTHFPVMGILRNLVMQILGIDRDVAQLRPAEINLYGGDSRQYALVVEELPDGRMVIFLPSAPAATIGQIHVLPRSAVTLLDAPVQDVLNAVTQWGAGASLIYRDRDQ